MPNPLAARPTASLSRFPALEPRRLARAARLVLALAFPALLSDPARAATLPPVATAPDARIYLTWHAPYGQPGATDQLMAACGDTTTKDTLYMCLDPGQNVEKFQSFTATLYFWAAGGDSIDPHWIFGQGRNFTRLEVQYAPGSVPGAEPAWPASAFASSGYSHSSASGKLMMIAAGPDKQGWPLEGGKTYVAARLLVPRPAVKTKDCDKSMCIEWSIALFGLGGGALPEVKAGQRFVSWNSRGGKVCATMRSFAAPARWKPKLPPPPGWKR